MSGVFFEFFSLHPVISPDSVNPSRLISCDLSDISCCPGEISPHSHNHSNSTSVVYFPSLYLYLSEPKLNMGRYHEGKLSATISPPRAL